MKVTSEGWAAVIWVWHGAVCFWIDRDIILFLPSGVKIIRAVVMIRNLNFMETVGAVIAMRERPALERHK